MRKVAVLICGQYREFDIAIKSWKFMPGDMQFDLYMSTWDTSYDEAYDTFNTPTSPIEVITAERIQKTTGFKNFKIFTEIKGDTVTRYLFLIKSCINMMKDSGIEYDYVIVIRPDLWVHEYMDIISLFDNPINDDVIYGTSILQHDSVDNPLAMDCIWIGNQKTIIKYLDIPERNYNRGMEHVLGEFYVNQRFDIRLIPAIRDGWSLCIVRSNCRDLTEFTFETLDKKAIEWWNTKHPEHTIQNENL